MASRFSSIGFPIRSRRELEALAERLLPECEEHRVRSGRYLRYASACGAELWFQVDSAGRLLGATPFFAAPASTRVELTGSVERPEETPLAGALRARVACPPGHSGASRRQPFLFDCPDHRAHGRLGFPATVDASIGAFARRLACYRTFEELEAAQSMESGVAPPRFIASEPASPEGRSTRPPRSEAVFAGRVLSAERRTNPATGMPFFTAEVESSEGPLHVVADPELVPQLVAVGDVLFGTFWLCGRVAQAPPGRSATGSAVQSAGGVLRRLFRR